MIYMTKTDCLPSSKTRSDPPKDATMKILCVADNLAPLVYSTNIKERFRDVDLVIGAGDLPMEYLGFIASSLNKPVLFVFGNHNLKGFDQFRKIRKNAVDYTNIEQHNYGSTYIDNKVVRIKGTIFAGLGGSIRYNHGENQHTELQMFGKILKLVPGLLWNRLVHGRYLDVLVAHSAPFGIHDKDDPCHVGFKSFLWFMRVFKPRFLLHGHIHLYDNNATRLTRYFQTSIINVYDHYVLEFQKPR